MSSPKGGTNISHSKEEKLALVLRNLSGETGICHTQIRKWTNQCLKGGDEALVNSASPKIHFPK